MVLDFVGAIATGLGLLGIVLLINILTGRRMASWVFPVTVALGMISFTAWSEQSWASRTLDAQPHLRLASQNSASVFYRPWTYIWPNVTRMITLDISQTRVHPDRPDQVLTQIVLLGRWQPVRAVTAVFDCAQNARADLTQSARLNDDGSIEGADWRPLEAENSVLRTACQMGEEIRNGQSTNA